MKLKEYLLEKNIQFLEFAKAGNIPYHAFVHALNGNRAIPRKYWDKIVELTHGDITINDLYAESSRKKTSH